jgi:hypothetical protein
MSGGLQHIEDDGARCSFCPRMAVGPCASCARPVCADCCTLTEGGVKVWAVCLDCDRRGGRSLRGAWGGLVTWLVLILVGLAAATAALGWLTHALR